MNIKADTDNDSIIGGIRERLAHDSGQKHVTGNAIYIDDSQSQGAPCTSCRFPATRRMPGSHGLIWTPFAPPKVSALC